jgi:hypothetical protein
MHKSQEILVTELAQAAKQVKAGSIYYHYKNPNQNYRVINLAITEADDTICVIYRAQYGERLIFVRPLDSWLSKVKWNNETVNRFTLLN